MGWGPQKTTFFWGGAAPRRNIVAPGDLFLTTTTLLHHSLPPRTSQRRARDTASDPSMGVARHDVLVSDIVLSDISVPRLPDRKNRKESFKKR